MTAFKNWLYRALRWSERYTKTDMVYLASSGFWTQSGSFFVSFASFLLYIVFGHFLSKDVYGTYQYLLSLGALVSAFTLSGMNSAVTRAIARGYEGTYLEAIRVQLLWNILPMLGSWSVGAYYLLHHNQTIGWGLVLIGIFTPLGTVYNTYSSYLGGKKDFRRGFIYNFYINLVYYIAVALVAVSLPFALVLLCANLISQTVGYFIAHRRVLAMSDRTAARDPEVISYGAHLSVMNLFGLVAAQADSIFVFHFLGATDLALYSFATAIPNRLGIFGSITSAAFPKYAQKSKEELRESIWRKLGLAIAGSVLVIIVYALLARPFFLLFFPAYLSSVWYSILYSATVVVSFGALFTTALTAQGRVQRLYAYNVIAPVILIGLELIGVVGWGLWGLIIAIVAATLIRSLLALGLALW